ncbi:hypothetical protein ACQ4LE_004820 [Meloidogyne hapla]
MFIFRFFLLVLFLLISTTCASLTPSNPKETKRQLKILIYSPSLSWSHAQFLGKIADTLVDAGHEVHFLKYIMDLDLKSKNETTRVNPAYKYIIEPTPENTEELDVKKNPRVTDAFTNKRPFLTLFDHPNHQFGPMFVTACKETIKERKLLQKLTEENFDVGIGENYDHCTAAIFHRIGVRVQLTAYAAPLMHWVARKYDIPTFASYVPTTFAPRLGLEFFSNRLINFYNEFYDWIWMHDHWKRLQEPVIRAEFGADFPDLNELVKKSSLVFINSNPFFDMPRPISNKIIYIGGLVHDSASPDSKILDKRTKNILDGAKEGAILFSFGSIADTSKLKNHMRNSIINAFRHFPKVQFIWKLDKETIKNLSELLKSVPNVHTFTWIRQAAILAHPNLKAFITHCGQNSLTESFRAGVPVIGLPLFADQFYNADLAQKHGIGLQIPVNELNGANAENLLIETIERILADRSFRQKAQIIAKKVQITPFDPKERLVKWVEFAAEFDNLSELDLPGANEMNWFAYYSIDVILFSTVIMLILLWLVWKVVKRLLVKIISILCLSSTFKNLFSENIKLEEEMRKQK